MKNARRKRIIRENIQLGILTVPALVLTAIFAYWPLFGLVLPFKKYTIPEGIWGSKWADPLFKNFEFLYKSKFSWRLIRNTIGLNALFIIIGTICSIIFALLMFEVKKAIHIKVYQTIAIVPYFLSMVAVAYIVYAILQPSSGVANRIIRVLGGEGIQWYNEPKYWPLILTLVTVWHGTGFGSLLYYATLMGVDGSLYEAARIDGANKLQEIIYISLPELVGILMIRLILSVGNIFRADFGLFYNVTRNQGMLYPTTDVFDTYIYRTLMQSSNIGMSAAGSFVQSVVCFVMLLTVNGIVRKITPENSLF